MKPIQPFLELLKNVRASGTDKWMACCPAHNDGQHAGGQSLSVSIKNEKILLKCFAGCATPDIVKTLGLKMSDLFLGEKKPKNPVGPRQPGARREVQKVYQYYNAGNTLIFEVVRYIPKAFSQRRPDGKGGYITNITGCERVIYRLPQILAAIGRGETIFHCEGEKDAENLVALGFEATTSPMGAGSWRADQAHYYHGAKKVAIIPDRDERGAAYAREVATDIYKEVGVVKILELPGEQVKDASDWIAGGGTAADLTKLEATTPPWTPVEMVPPGEIDYAAMKKELEEASNGQYTIENKSFQRVYWVKNKGEDEPEEKSIRLCNFVARMTDDIIKDDGAVQSRSFRIQGRLNGSNLPLITVPDNQFDSMLWPRKYWGAKAQVEKTVDKVERHLTQSIFKASGRVRERFVFAHSGWTDIDNQHMFLTAGGAVGHSDIEVELPPPLLSKVHLPQLEGDGIEAISKSFEMMNIGDIELTLPTFIWPYLSVLNVFKDMNFTIWYQGKTGQFKTVITALAMSHFGNFTANDLTYGWDTTIATLEKLSHCAKDIPFPIDDYAPAPDKTLNRQMKNNVAYMLQAFGNRQGKGRSNPDMTGQFTYFPRGLLVTSGEHLPTVTQSRQARLFPIPISLDNFFKDDKGNYEFLTQAQKDRQYYPQAMAHFIAWVERNWSAVGKTLQDYHDKYHRDISKAGIHLRLPETAALMQAGYNVIMDFAVDKGIVPSSDVAGHLDNGWSCLKRLLKMQSSKVNISSPGIRFIDTILGLLPSGKIAFRRRNGDGSWGTGEAGPGQIYIGWDDGEGTVYLNPNEAYAQVHTFCEKSEDYFGHPKAAVWEDLDDLGYLVARGDVETRTILKTKRFGGHPLPVIWLKRSVLFGEEDKDNEI
jgi:hypothetical protein